MYRETRRAEPDITAGVQHLFKSVYSVVDRVSAQLADHA